MIKLKIMVFSIRKLVYTLRKIEFIFRFHTQFPIQQLLFASIAYKKVKT